MDEGETLAILREIVAHHSGIPDLPEDIEPSQDLFYLGLTSLGCVRVMVAIEDAFDLVLPDEAVTITMFESLINLEQVVLEQLGIERDA